jgi:hypothetical protein
MVQTPVMNFAETAYVELLETELLRLSYFNGEAWGGFRKTTLGKLMPRLPQD